MTELPPIRDARRPSLRQSIAVVVCVLLVFGVLASLLLLDARPGGAETPDVGRITPAPAWVAAAQESSTPAPPAPSELLPRSNAPAGETEVCGVGWMSLEGDPEAVVARGGQLMEESAARTKSLLLPAMMASADERTRAAALRFLSHLIGTIDLDVLGCAPGPECEFTRRRAAVAKVSREALASMAVATSDPQVYAWALQACALTSPEESSACQMIHVEQWARIDPDNGAAWHRVALQAHARHDTAAVDDAMYHLAMASRYDEGWGALPGRLLESLPTGEEHLLGAEQILVEAIGIDSADAVAPMQTLTDYCAVKLLGDSNRRQICGRIADNLLGQSKTLLSRQIGRTLLARMGGSAPQLQSTSDQLDAFKAASSAEAEEPLALDCHTIERHLERGRDLAQLGEVELARRAVAKSGKTVAELASGWRAQMQKIAASFAVERAASGAQDAASAPRVAAAR